MERSDAKRMKEMNKEVIRDCFRTHSAQTARGLSEKSGLSIVTVNALLKEMLETGEVLTGEHLASGGGRPSAVYEYNKRFRCAVIIYGFQEEQTNCFKIAVADLYGNILMEEKHRFAQLEESSFELMLDEVFLKFPSIGVLAFGLPGEEENGVIHISDHPGLVGHTFMERYESRYRVPVIFVNDINAAVKGYCHRQKDVCPQDTVAGIYFPMAYPPGMGLVIDGTVYTGQSNFAGELGCMPVGIQWETLDYSNKESVLNAVGRLVAAICCIVAPKQIILYGEFFRESWMADMKCEVERLLEHKFCVQLEISDTVEKDYECGMICSALEHLEKAKNRKQGEQLC